MLIGQSGHRSEITGEFLVDGKYVLKLKFNQNHTGAFQYYIFTYIFSIYKLPVIIFKHLKKRKALFTICYYI